MERRKDRRGSRHERVVEDNRQRVGELHEVEAGNGSCCDESSSHHGAAANDDDSHHDVGCSHGKEVGHGRSSRQMVDNRRLDGTVGASESDSGHCVEPRLGSIDGLSRRAKWKEQRENVRQPRSER